MRRCRRSLRPCDIPRARGSSLAPVLRLTRTRGRGRAGNISKSAAPRNDRWGSFAQAAATLSDFS